MQAPERWNTRMGCAAVGGLLLLGSALAQLTDTSQTPNALNEGIHKSLTQEIGAGRGDALTPNASLYLIQRNYDGTLQKQWLTRALWGVGSTSPYGHDGRSVNLTEVILRHGGEAQKARDAFANLTADSQDLILAFLNALILFPPEDTASNLDPGNRNAPNFPQAGHGSIKLVELFNDPTDLE